MIIVVTSTLTVDVVTPSFLLLMLMLNLRSLVQTVTVTIAESALFVIITFIRYNHDLIMVECEFWMPLISDYHSLDCYCSISYFFWFGLE